MIGQSVSTPPSPRRFADVPSLRRVTDPLSRRPLEVAAPVVALFFLPIWIELFLMAVYRSVGFPDWLPPFYDAAVLSLVWLAAFAVLFAVVRPVDRFLRLPARDSVGFVGVAVLAPAALVLLTDLVAGLRGVAYVRLAEVPAPLFALPESAWISITVEQWLTMTLVWLVFGVASSLVVCQLVVQASLRDSLGPRPAVAAAACVGAAVLVGQGLDLGVAGTGYPIQGNIAALLLWLAVIGVAIAGTVFAERRWLRRYALAPTALLALATLAQFAGLVGSGGLIGAELDLASASVPTVTHVVALVLIVALAAYGYERTRSILTPALAYASTYLTAAFVVGVFEAPHLF